VSEGPAYKGPSQPETPSEANQSACRGSVPLRIRPSLAHWPVTRGKPPVPARSGHGRQANRAHSNLPSQLSKTITAQLGGPQTIATATGHPDGQRRATRALSSTAPGPGSARMRLRRAAYTPGRVGVRGGLPQQQSNIRHELAEGLSVRDPSRLLAMPPGASQHPVRCETSETSSRSRMVRRYRSPLRDPRHPKQATLRSGHGGRVSARRRAVPVWIGRQMRARSGSGEVRRSTAR
jgi:hypothetical protein